MCVYVRFELHADIGAEFGDVRPLDEARIRILTVNGGQVLDRITSDSVFLTELANAGCITWSQREYLMDLIPRRDRNERLTEFLTRRSVADFQKFMNVLAKEHDFLVPLFLTGEGEYILAVQSWLYRVVQKSKPPHFISSYFHQILTDYQYFSLAY